MEVKTKYFGPESAYMDRLKGQVCNFKMYRPPDVTGILLWVDRYTFGVKVQGREIVIYKAWVVSIERGNGNGSADRGVAS